MTAALDPKKFVGMFVWYFMSKNMLKLLENILAWICYFQYLNITQEISIRDLDFLLIWKVIKIDIHK